MDDGTILTGKPNQFDGKNPWFPVDFPHEKIASELGRKDRVASLNAELQGRSPQEILQWAAWHGMAWLETT